MEYAAHGLKDKEKQIESSLALPSHCAKLDIRQFPNTDLKKNNP
jgi:hypothetical protein